MSDPIWRKVRNGSHRSYKAPKRKLRASPSSVFGAPKKQKPGIIRIDDLMKLGTNAPTQANHGQVSVNMATSQPLRDSAGRRSTSIVVHTQGSSAGPARQNNTSPTPMTPDDMTAWSIGFLQDPNMQRLLQNSLSVFDSAIRDNFAHIATLEDNFNIIHWFGDPEAVLPAECHKNTQSRMGRDKQWWGHWRHGTRSGKQGPRHHYHYPTGHISLSPCWWQSKGPSSCISEIHDIQSEGQKKSWNQRKIFRLISASMRT